MASSPPDNTKKQRCRSCGAEILPATAKRNSGRCRPCAKKGWYGRLWEIVRGTGRPAQIHRPSPAIVELRRLLELTPRESATFDELFDDLESHRIGAGIDWRSTPEEVFASLRAIRNWVEPSEEIEEESADILLECLAQHHKAVHREFLNLIPGTDGWFIIIVPKAQVSILQKAAVQSGLDRPGLV